MAPASSLMLGLAHFRGAFYSDTFLTGVPHATTMDDVVQGYHIPKGAINIYHAL